MKIDIFGDRQDFVAEAIKRGKFDLIPPSRMTESFEKQNPWPPPQFTEVTDDTKFCTWCGETISRYIQYYSSETENKHNDCLKYGKHCRHKDLDPKTYYVRVWSYGGNPGRHHYDPDKKQAVMVQNLSSGTLQLAKPKDYQPSWSLGGGYLIRNSQYNLDYCVCDCDGCEETFHCGDDLIGCHEKPLKNAKIEFEGDSILYNGNTGEMTYPPGYFKVIQPKKKKDKKKKKLGRRKFMGANDDL